MTSGDSRRARAIEPPAAPARSVPGGALLALLGGLLVACAPAADAPRDAPPNIVLIVVDTLRWDRVGAYGADRETSPEIDALAAQSIRFERAYATAPWTRPSIGSILTGLFPSSHGGWAADRGLPEDIVTLAEMLSAGGYATAAVVSNFVIARAKGFAQGFEHFDQTEIGGFDHVSTEGVTRQAIAALDTFAAAPGRPFFLFVHYFDPHYDYRQHAEVDFAAARAGHLDGTQTMNELYRMARTLTPREIAHLRDLYDEEIRHTDAGVGRLLRQLAAHGLADETVVAFTSDHGEEFLDHGGLGHTETLYEELIRVPLLLRIPGVEPRAFPGRVSLVALTPTLLDLAGVSPPPGHALQAESLLARLSADADRSDGYSFAEVDFDSPVQRHKRASRRAIVGERYKLIRDRRTGRLELYDLTRDPLEQRDLAASDPDVVARLEPILATYVRRAAAEALPASPQALDAAEIERLRELGYAED